MNMPRGWCQATLADVAKWSSGGTPQAGNPSYYGGPIPWVVIGDLKDGIVRTTRSTITNAGLANSSAKVVPPETILVAMYGSIGKLGIAGHEMATNQAIATAVVNGRVDRKYLFYYLLSQREGLAAAGKGAAQRNISQSIIKPWPIHFPVEVKAQRRIVQALEDCLSHLDTAAANVAVARRRLRRLQERLVLDAITGADHGGERPPFQIADVGTHDGELPALPHGWNWLRLGDVADIVGGVTKDAKKQADPSFVEVPYLRVANVQRGHLDLEHVTRIRVSPSRAESLRLRHGDVLLNEGGDRDKLARGWVWDAQIERCIHQNHVFRARIRDPRLDPYFLSWTANTIGGRWAERNGKQSVNLASISLSMIRRMPVIVPPSGEAASAVAKLHERLDSLARLHEAIAQAQARNAALRRSVLAAAFSGDLSRWDRERPITHELVNA